MRIKPRLSVRLDFFMPVHITPCGGDIIELALECRERKHGTNSLEMTPMSGTHEFVEDDRNRNVLVYVNGELFPRDAAKISVFDSAFLVGDGFWESFRLHNGKLAFVKQHLARLKANAKALDYSLPMPPEALLDEVYRTVRANGMTSNDVTYSVDDYAREQAVAIARPADKYRRSDGRHHCRVQGFQPESGRRHSSVHGACTAWRSRRAGPEVCIHTAK